MKQTSPKGIASRENGIASVLYEFLDQKRKHDCIFNFRSPFVETEY